MTKTKTFLEMSCKRDMMIISYLNIFRFKISLMFRLFISGRATRVLFYQYQKQNVIQI